VAKKKNKKKDLLPKRIGGVKVPKALRRGRAARFLTSPMGVDLISGAIVAAAGAAAAKQARPGSATREFADHPLAGIRHLAGDAREGGQHGADTLKRAFAAAQQAFSDTLVNAAVAVEPAKKATARGAASTTAARAAH